LHRLVLAFRSFFQILFHGALAEPLLIELGLTRLDTAKPAAPVAPAVRASDGALQMLGILQRDSRLIDFIMEDIAPYTDDQVGAAVRTLHDQCREALSRYLTLQPVIDGVEGTYTRAPGGDAALVKFIGNVPAGTPQGGVLRHKGWRAAKVDLPAINTRQDAAVIAPAEIEIE
jgi:hypothetical protein